MFYPLSFAGLPRQFRLAGIWRYMAEQILQQRKQTYPFKTMGINDTFNVSKAKYNSMLTAYRYHNKKYSPIEIKAEYVGNSITVTRTA